MTTKEFPRCVMFGSLRSGTTMLRLMLDAHPDLVCPGEADFLVDFLVKDPQGQWRYDIEGLARNRIFQSSRARLPDIDEAGPAFRQMTADLMGDDEGTLVIVIHRRLERLLDICPDLAVLHMVRDPRDVARSAIGMGWAGTVFYGADTWLTTEREWQRVSNRLAPYQSLTMYYEHLVREPKVALAEISRFVGLDYSPAMMEYVETSSFDRPDPTLAEQWRRKQSEREVALVEYRVGSLLKERGYSPSGQPKIVPGPLMRIALWIQNKKGIWSWRIRRHGWVDPILSAIARRLRLPFIARNATLRMRQTNSRLRK
jgi:hypothetical protein